MSNTSIPEGTTQAPLSVYASGTWSFVFNPVDVQVDLPFEFVPGCRLEKATPEQRERIRSRLQSLVGTERWMSPTALWENEVVRSDEGRSWSLIPLPEDQWRYYVISTDDRGRKNHRLHLCSNISEVPLELSVLTFTDPAWGYRMGILSRVLHEPTPQLAKKLTAEDLVQLGNIYERFTSVTSEGEGATKFPELERAMNLLDSLSFLERNSEFHVLGLFAIIEMLITHNPKLEDRGDSITHQMQSKIPLLGRRFDKPLPFGFHFGNTGESKVWAALYKYRSVVAHGGFVDFSETPLKLLIDADNAKAFLRTCVKSMIRHALIEPMLYRDLRQC